MSDAPQFVRVSFLADDDFSFTVFPNETPGALLSSDACSSGQLPANSPPCSHSQLRVLKKTEKAVLSFLAILSASRSHVLSYSCLNGRAREHLTGSSRPKAAPRARSAVKDESNRGRTKEEGRGRRAEKQACCGAGLFEISGK